MPNFEDTSSCSLVFSCVWVTERLKVVAEPDSYARGWLPEEMYGGRGPVGSNPTSNTV